MAAPARPQAPPTAYPCRAPALWRTHASSGVWKDLATQTWTSESTWGGQALKIPAAEIQDGQAPWRRWRMIVSDLEPSKVEETAFFGHRMPWRRDVNLLGEPLRMHEKVPANAASPSTPAAA